MNLYKSTSINVMIEALTVNFPSFDLISLAIFSCRFLLIPYLLNVKFRLRDELKTAASVHQRDDATRAIKSDQRNVSTERL